MKFSEWKHLNNHYWFRQSKVDGKYGEIILEQSIFYYNKYKVTFTFHNRDLKTLFDKHFKQLYSSIKEAKAAVDQFIKLLSFI